jgi:hypothetical protein
MVDFDLVRDERANPIISTVSEFIERTCGSPEFSSDQGTVGPT